MNQDKRFLEDANNAHDIFVERGTTYCQEVTTIKL